MIWDGLIRLWGKDPDGMSEEEKILEVAAVADRVEETREAQLVLFLVRSEHMRANAVFNEARVDRDVLSEHAAVARSLNGILGMIQAVKMEREEVKTVQSEPVVEEEGEPYTGPVTGQRGDV